MAKRKRTKGQKDKQRSSKDTHTAKDRVTRIPLKTGGELRWSGRVSSAFFRFLSKRLEIYQIEKSLKARNPNL
jgi:hypothetical protein